MPAATGTVAVSGNMPAFSAYDSAGTSVASGTFTKLAFATEEFDTNNNFASSRFTPTVAGYYQINGYYLTAAASVGLMSCQIYKNGAVYKYGSQTPNSVNVAGSVVSSMVYMNGTTDYVEIYAYQASGGTYTSYVSGLVTSFFNGSMVRAA
jgi:hypothetical protein